MVYRFVVASYTDALHTLAFDPSKPADSALAHISSTTVGRHPSWVEGHPSDRTLLFTGLEQTDGQLLVLRYDPESGEGKVIEKVASGGSDPAHIFVDENQVLVGNYSSGTVGIFEITRSSQDIKVAQSQPPIEFNGTGPVKERQEKSHPHQLYSLKVQRDGASVDILVPDLGSDKIYHLSKSNEGEWEKKAEIVLDEKHRGGGPRHVVVQNSKIYILLELTSEIIVYPLASFEEASSSATLLAEAKLPMPDDLKPLTMLAAELLCPSPNARFPQALLYASNRNDPRPHGDIISVFAEYRDGQNQLELVGQVFTGLQHVRAFSFFGPDDRYMITGGANGGGVKVFERQKGDTQMREVAHLPVADGGPGLAPTGFLSV